MGASSDVRRWVDVHWPALRAPEVVYRLLSDPRFLADCAAGVLSEDEQRLQLWPTVPSSPRTARWTSADAFLIDEAAGVLRRPTSFGHLGVDEAQDLSAMQCRALGRRCATGSATVLGDLAQATATGAVADWGRTLSLLN